MKRDEVLGELARLGVVGVAEEPAALSGRQGVPELLLAIESLALTLDDGALRASSLVALALARQDRGETERADELRAMARRTGHVVAEASDARSAGDVAAWFRVLLLDGAPLPVAALRELSGRLRAALLLAFAPRLRAAPQADEARAVARDLLASEDLLVATGALHALAALDGLDDDAARVARDRLAAKEARGVALEALVKVGRRVELPEPDTGDLAADAVLQLARVRLAAEKRDLATARELSPRATRAVTELRVKRRLAEATDVFVHALPIVAAVQADDVGLLESLIEDPVLAWGYRSASAALSAFAAATTKLAFADAALAALEQSARFALRRIRHSDDGKKALPLFEGVAACARAAAWLGDPRPLCERIAAGAREKMLHEVSFFSRHEPIAEYRALLGCGEALARAGDRSALAGAIAALASVSRFRLADLLDDALASAEAAEAPELSLAVLELARPRLEEPEVARWLAQVALRAGALVGREAALARWKRADERRIRTDLAARLR